MKWETPRPPFIAEHLYVHVPVCTYRCDYCDFFSRVGVSPERQKLVIDQTVQQGNALLGSGIPNLTTLYVGGGTPSALDPHALETLLRWIKELTTTATAKTLEVTVEVNPEDITPRFLSSLASVGVNRLSLGVQSFHADALKTIGRHSSIEDTRRGVELLAQNWTGTWSGDIIVGIPGTHAVDVRSDIDTILGYGPSHLSIYELGIETDTVLGLRLRQGLIQESPEEVLLEHGKIAETVLSEAGFRRYEVSSYALPGKESRHNLGYWRMSPYIGIGPGSVGTIAPGSIRPGDPLRVRFMTGRSFASFLGRSFGMTTEELDRWDIAKEACMMGFRTIEGVSSSFFRHIAGVPIESVLARTLDEWSGAFEWISSSPLTETRCEPFIRIRNSHWNVLDRIIVDIFRDIDAVGSSFHTGI